MFGEQVLLFWDPQPDKGDGFAFEGVIQTYFKQCFKGR